MQFDGPAPELVNGRAAMLGFAAALFGELHTGESVLNLLNDVPQGVIVVFTLILIGSLFPLTKGLHPHHKAHGFFTAENEIWGGRFACALFLHVPCRCVSCHALPRGPRVRAVQQAPLSEELMPDALRDISHPHMPCLLCRMVGFVSLLATEALKGGTALF